MQFSILSTVSYCALFFSACKKDETPSPIIPSINSISTTRAAEGDTLSLSGDNFSSDPTANLVKFDDKNVVVVNASSTLLTVIVPAGLATGNVIITVTVNGQVKSFPFLFTRLARVTTLAGSGIDGTVNAQGKSASFHLLTGLTIDASDNLFVCDGYLKIRKITSAGLVSSFVDASFVSPPSIFAYSITRDNSGNFYSTDQGHIKKITSAGIITTLAGGGSGTSPSDDGTGSNAYFESDVRGLTVDASGNLFVTEASRIRKVTPTGVVTTIAGIKNGLSFADGDGANARFSQLYHITIDASGNLYVADAANQRIRKISPSGTVSTFAGNGTLGSVDGTGTSAQFAAPSGIVFDASGNLYVTEDLGNKIRKISPSGVVTTLSGSAAGYKDGNIEKALFNRPHGIAVDALGNLLVLDQGNFVVRKITF